MTEPPVRAVLAALAGASIAARFVGGCVRNTLIDRPIDDIDIAVNAPPALVVEALERAGLKAVATGIEHGTITAVSAGRGFEITSLRRDIETFGRHARVEFTDDWLEDAKRRDFTINAMFLDGLGALYDAFDGRADLADGRVRFVGDAQARIAEDYLRVFRFFRFFAWYGRPPADAGGLAACRAATARLTALSAERVQKEMLKLLTAPDPLAAVSLMLEAGVLAEWLPEARSGARLAALLLAERARNIGPAPLRRLAALVEGDGGAPAARLKLSRADGDALQVLCADKSDILAGADGPARRRAIYRRGRAFADCALLALAEAQSGGNGAGANAAAAALDLAGNWQAPQFPLRGADLLALGLPAGPRVGEVLRAVEQWWIDGDFGADRAACLAELKRRIGAA